MPKAKVVVIGSARVGKSCLTMRMKTGDFNEEVLPTIGAANIPIKVLKNDGTSIELDIWDTAGQERYRSLTPMYFTGASIALLVFDLTSHETFLELDTFRELLEDAVPGEVLKVLIGNKVDLVDDRQVGKDEIDEYAKRINAKFYFEASAKTGENVEKILPTIAEFDKIKTVSNVDDEYETVIAMQKAKDQNTCC